MEKIENIIKVIDGKVSARELHKELEIGTQFTKWISRMIEYGFTENIDYVLVRQKRLTNNIKNPYTEETDYIITLDMAKHIAMIQRTPLGVKIRNYFIQCEKYIIETKQTEAFNQWRKEEAKEHSNNHKHLNAWECKVIDSSLYTLTNGFFGTGMLLQKDDLLIKDNFEISEFYEKARIFAYEYSKGFMSQKGRLYQQKFIEALINHYGVTKEQYESYRNNKLVIKNTIDFLKEKYQLNDKMDGQIGFVTKYIWDKDKRNTYNFLFQKAKEYKII